MNNVDWYQIASKISKAEGRVLQKVVLTKINWFWPQAQVGGPGGGELAGNNPTNNKQTKTKQIDSGSSSVRGETNWVTLSPVVLSSS